MESLVEARMRTRANMQVHGRYGSRRFLLRTAVLLTLAVALVARGKVAEAQLASTGTIEGTVTDTTGAVVPGAAVMVENTATEVTTKTASSGGGVFVIPGLRPGSYSVTVVKAGFNTIEISDVEVHPTVVANIAPVLHVGKVAAKVSVTATGAQIQLTSPAVSHDISARQVANLPMNGRNYQTLAALMPGAVNMSPGTQMGQGGFGTNNVLSSNGMGLSGTYYTVDGIWNENTGNFTQTSVTPPPDTIQEVRILQNNYSAQYNMMGANVVIVQTKSGTRQFHGSAYDFLRNDALNARNYFSPTVSSLKQNIYGYTLGGPFYIPHVYNQDRNKTFFFWSQQWAPQRITSVIRGISATAAERGGDFSALLPKTKIKDPETGKPFPGNIIPPDKLIPQAVALLNASTPLPNNVAGGALNYLNSDPRVNSQRNDFIKVDQYFTQNYRLTAEYFGEHATSVYANNQTDASPFNTSKERIIWPDYLTQVQFSAAITPSMLNVASVAMNHRVVSLTQTGTTLLSQVPDYSQSLPFTGGLGADRLPQVTFSQGYSPFGASNRLPLINNSNLDLTFFDDWSWVHGKHYLQIGVAWYDGLKRQTNAGASNGLWHFSGTATGNAIADFLLGDAATLSQTNTETRPTNRYPIVSPYVEDTWKVTPRLTLSGGIRYLWMPVPHAPRGSQTIFDPAAYNPAHAPIVNKNGTITATPDYDPLNGLVYNGVNGVALNYANVHSSFWAPTVGFALDLFGNGKTSLRGGYGIAYSRTPTASDCSLSCSNNPPTVQSITLVRPSFPFAVGGIERPAGAPSLQSEVRDLRPGQIQSYSLSLEHQLPGNWVVSIAGAGNIVRHGGAALNYNQPLPEGGYDFDPEINTGTVFTYYNAPYQGYAAITTKTSSGVAYWNALELSAHHRFGHGLYASAAYTWQHDLSNMTGPWLFAGRGKMQDVYHPERNYGNSQINIPQVFAMSAIWSLPWYREASGFKRQILGGWQIADITTVQSGFSLDPDLASAHKGLATRPDVVASLKGPKSVQEWFNADAFVQPPAGFFGNASSGSIRGPGTVVFNLAVHKSFRIYEGHQIQFRAEAFNIFNHTNFSTVNTAFDSPAYDQVTNARDPRIAEFALRYSF